jgi:hypothetical protein
VVAQILALPTLSGVVPSLADSPPIPQLSSMRVIAEMFCWPRLVAYLSAFVLAEMQTTRILTVFFAKFERAGSQAARLLGQVPPGGHLPGDQEGETQHKPRFPTIQQQQKCEVSIPSQF